MHEDVVLLTVTTEHVPEVAEAQRFTVERLPRGLSRVVLHYGFMEVPSVAGALEPALRALELHVALDELLFILGRETLIVTRAGRMRRITEPIFAFLVRNVRGVTDTSPSRPGR